MSYKIKGNVVVSGSSLTVNAVEVVKETTAQTLTNKTIDADQNTITNIENADIKAGAAIDVSKLADGSVSNTEFQYLNGVTSPIQSQLDDKASNVLPEDNILVGNASNEATAVDTSLLGEIEATVAGGLVIKAGVIVNADINSAAAIDATKIADGSVSNAEFQYLNGVTSDIQTQLNDKQSTTLPEQSIWVGNASNEAAAVDTATLGDIEATELNGLELKAGVIENANINAAAAIDLTKLAVVAANRALQSDNSGYIQSSSVTSTELGYLSGVTSAIQDQLNDKLDLAGGTMTGDIAMGGNQVTGLGAPVASSDAATKGYVDSVAEGLKPKTAARVATTAPGTLASDFENGDTVDGITLVTGDRILIKDQSSAAENGIYTVNASGAPTRATDFDSLTPIDEVNGAMVAVQEGTANAGKVFVQSGLVTAIGTDPINFIFFNSSSSLVGGDGITISGNNVSVDHDGEGLQFVAAQLALELDGASLSKSASGLRVANLGVDTAQLAANSVTEAKLNASVAGDGIAGGAGTALSVDHDGEGLQFVANQLALELDGATLSKSATGLKVADLGIDTAQLANSAVTTAKINNAAVDETKLSASVAGDGIAGGGGTALSVDHDGQGLQFVANQLALELDGSTLSKAAAGLKVADGGITNTQVNAAAAIDRSKLATGTAHAIVINDGGGVLSSSVALTNGQVLIGETGAAPVAATLTAGAGISITNGAGSITIAAVGGSAGDIAETSFSANNNVVSPTNVTGFAFANATVRSFDALVSIALIATAEAYEVITLRGIQKNGSWDMSQTSNGDDSGVEFTITNAGQIQYTSANSAGFSSNTIKFRAITTSV